MQFPGLLLGYGSVTIATLMFLWQPSGLSACSCAMQHPQQRFCDADFVLKARVKNSHSASEQNDGVAQLTHRTYNIRTRKLLKTSEKYESLSNLTKMEISTPRSESLCGILNLHNHTNHLIMGTVEEPGRLWFTLCKGIAREWRRLPIHERKGVLYRYERHCNCKVKPCYQPNCGETNTDADMCKWSPLQDSNDCHIKHSWCRRTSDGRCKWAAPDSMKTCLTNNGAEQPERE